MKVIKLETYLTHAGLRNYLFVRLITDKGLTGIGEASLEWQEKTVETLIHEWVKDRILGADPFNVEKVIGDMIRDQYQGGATIMTAISGVEVAMWDLIGKSCGEPVYRLMGGQCREKLRSYANGWYGQAVTPEDYAQKAKAVINTGYTAMKFDPFGTAWKDMNRSEMDRAEEIVDSVRLVTGEHIELMIEAHGRLSVRCAVEMGERLVKYRPFWYEEPVTPNSLELLSEVKSKVGIPIAAGERLYTLEDFCRLVSLRAADIIQMDICHCGGLHISKKIAALAQSQDVILSPHCSIGPVALCAAVHFGFCTPNVLIQENFSEYDVPWRNDLVHGWNLIGNGFFNLPTGSGLGIDIDVDVCRAHPYQPNTFPSLWDKRWLENFTQKDRGSHE